MAQQRDDDRLKQLEQKLAKHRKAQGGGKLHQEEGYSQAQIAWRMVIELVAGLGIGFGIGYGLDYLFGTSPVFLVLFIFLGFAAGVKTMIGTAKEVEVKRPGGEPPSEDERE
ncbi:AtpZ/AtpI family protein [Qingshengfaniella alkalisoli]|uniref:ATP synthase protein I n=1 Tax=Qingshengfaniella alkalisoli TaxID=2599296 RepID=A0A5B8I7X2_9RHOB|nr:AtpZ/AtpI family protein [Qingshengfaniella alkalisoli]QDY69739.1 AtpZ/AtpI family protein [Qingshengfaniella alkalisoli]